MLYICLMLKLCVCLNPVCRVRRISYSNTCLWRHWAAFPFPKRLLHPPNRKRWKINLSQNILKLTRNFIPLYRCSDTCNKLNKNMSLFLRIFIWLNAHITSLCLLDDLKQFNSILYFRLHSTSEIFILEKQPFLPYMSNKKAKHDTCVSTSASLHFQWVVKPSPLLFNSFISVIDFTLKH